MSSRVPTNEATMTGRMFMWFAAGSAADGPASLLAVHVQHPEGFTFMQPLIAGSLQQANEQTAMAEDAAAYLGVTAELREYQLVSVRELEPAGSAS